MQPSILSAPVLAMLGALALWPALAVGAKAQDKDGGNTPVRAVVELFTSQGCSSCPPADALLKVYAERPGVVALTLPVDVWDYLGWRDTLAHPKFAERQRAYARKIGNGKVFTPQVVISGASQVKGGRQDEIDRGLEKQRASAAIWVSARMSVQGKTLEITIPAVAAGRTVAESTVWVAMIQSSVTVAVRKGENGGRSLTYTNVVRELIPVGMWSGKELVVRLDRAAIVRPGVDACAVLIQNGTDGPIVGASIHNHI